MDSKHKPIAYEKWRGKIVELDFCEKGKHIFLKRLCHCGAPWWPIEEFITRTDFTDTQNEELKRLNPDGKCEMILPKGIHWFKKKDGEFIYRFIGGKK